jgi:hypothetical protein
MPCHPVSPFLGALVKRGGNRIRLRSTSLIPHTSLPLRHPTHLRPRTCSPPPLPNATRLILRSPLHARLHARAIPIHAGKAAHGTGDRGRPRAPQLPDVRRDRVSDAAQHARGGLSRGCARAEGGLAELNEVFTVPNIVKVRRAVGFFVVSVLMVVSRCSVVRRGLQQDFSLYVVNLFDTYHASKLLGPLPSFSTVPISNSPDRTRSFPMTRPRKPAPNLLLLHSRQMVPTSRLANTVSFPFHITQSSRAHDKSSDRSQKKCSSTRSRRHALPPLHLQQPPRRASPRRARSLACDISVRRNVHGWRVGAQNGRW